MARVTVEDCIIHKVENRFLDLVLLAGQRPNDLSGAQIAVERDKEQNSVVAPREIAEQAISPATSRRNWSIRCRNTSRWMSRSRG